MSVCVCCDVMLQMSQLAWNEERPSRFRRQQVVAGACVTHQTSRPMSLAMHVMGPGSKLHPARAPRARRPQLDCVGSVC